MSTVQSIHNGNPGIVPPWLGQPTVAGGDQNPGIVPPWLTNPAPQPGDQNPGTVPPWLSQDPNTFSPKHGTVFVRG